MKDSSQDYIASQEVGQFPILETAGPVLLKNIIDYIPTVLQCRVFGVK